MTLIDFWVITTFGILCILASSSVAFFVGYRAGRMDAEGEEGT